MVALKEWLNDFQKYQVTAQLASTPQNTAAGQKQLIDAAIDALRSSDNAAAISTEEGFRNFINNPYSINEALLEGAERYGAKATLDYKKNKKSLIRDAKDKGLAKIVKEFEAPKLGKDKIDKSYESLVKINSEIKKIEKILENNGPNAEEIITAYALTIMKENIEKAAKSNPIYKGNDDLKNLVISTGERLIQRGHGKDYLAGKLQKLYKARDEKLPDDKAKAAYARYALSRLDDPLAMNYLFAAERN